MQNTLTKTNTEKQGRKTTNKSIKVLHVIRSLDPSTGGPVFALAQMVKVSSERGFSVDVATTVSTDDGKAEPPLTSQIIQNGARCFSFPRQIGKKWSLSLQLWSWLKKNISNYDLIHITGVFTFPALIAAYEAQKAGIPYIIRPAGTLDAYPLKQKARRKKFYYRVFVTKILDGACAIHVTSKSERKQLTSLFSKNNCVVIPLSITLPKSSAVKQKTNHNLNLLFLSRIHPKKGLPVLLEALSILRRRGIPAALTIAGDGSSTYLDKIKRLIRELELGEAVHFTGFVQGREKSRLFEEADLFVLPSYQENFGIAVVEAMAAGLAVIVSDRIALAEEIANNNAGAVVPVDMPEALADKILAFSDSEYLTQMGIRARNFAAGRFTAEKQGQQLEDLYTEITGA